MALTKVVTNAITDDAITAAKIADGTIVAADIAADSVDSSELVAGSVDTAHIAADNIVASLIADDAIDSEHYTDGSIDNAHIADDAIDSEHYADGSIDTAHIADNQVTLAKMDGLARGKIIYGNASGDPTALTVGSSGQALVSDGTDISWGSGGAISTYSNSTNNRVITSVDSSSVNSEANLTFDGSTLAVTGAATVSTTLAVTGIATFTGVPVLPANTIDSAHYVDGSIDTAHIAADQIVASLIADNAIDSEHYTDGSIDNAHIADDAIDSEHYANGSIDNAHIADDAIDSEHYADGSIDNAHIADDAIDSEHYADGSIDNAHIADDQIGSEHYAAGSVDTTALGADAVTAAKIADDVVNSEHYAAASIDGEHLAVGKDGALSLDGSPDSDHTAVGPQTTTFASGYSSTIMDLVYLGSSSKWLEADSDATGTSINLLGIALEAKTDTQAMNVALPNSFVRDDTWNWTPGVPLYVSGTLGAITATKPTGSGDIVRTVGFAVHADMIYFNPSPDYITLA